MSNRTRQRHLWGPAPPLRHLLPLQFALRTEPRIFQATFSPWPARLAPSSQIASFSSFMPSSQVSSPGGPHWSAEATPSHPMLQHPPDLHKTLSDLPGLCLSSVLTQNVSPMWVGFLSVPLTAVSPAPSATPST